MDPNTSTPSRIARGNQGFSLVELMVAMAIVGLFLGGVFYTFTNFLSHSGEQAALSKRRFDTQIGLDLLRRDLRKAGFGIAEGDLGGAVAAGAGGVADTRIQIWSTAVHSRHDFAGRHGVVFLDPGGNKVVNNGLGGTIDANQPGIVMTPDRRMLEVVPAGNITAAEGNLFFAGPQQSQDGYYYRREYLLRGGGGASRCARNTNHLSFRDGEGDPPWVNDPNDTTSIVDCVLDLQFRYGYELSGGGIGYNQNPGNGPTGAVDDRPDVIKVGMMIQVGHRYRDQTPTPGTMNYNDGDLQLGAPVNLNTDQQHYRWRLVEWSIPLENMP